MHPRALGIDHPDKARDVGLLRLSENGAREQAETDAGAADRTPSGSSTIECAAWCESNSAKGPSARTEPGNIGEYKRHPAFDRRAPLFWMINVTVVSTVLSARASRCLCLHTRCARRFYRTTVKDCTTGFAPPSSRTKYRPLASPRTERSTVCV